LKVPPEENFFWGYSVFCMVCPSLLLVLFPSAGHPVLIRYIGYMRDMYLYIYVYIYTTAAQ
jgi:hypothetical protein